MGNSSLLEEHADAEILSTQDRVGRPLTYKPEFAEQAKKLCQFGATDMELAEFFQVSDRTIYRWINTFPEFCQALKMGKDIADDRVERSLYHKAVGYTHDAVKIMTLTSRSGEDSSSEIVQVPYVEHIPPSDIAAIFWLKNRRPKEWRDRVEASPEIKDLVEFTLRIGKAAGAIEERQRQNSIEHSSAVSRKRSASSSDS